MIKIHKELDRLLGGELLPKNITQFYGPSASGKTNIALMATVSGAKDGKVIYIDPEGGFSVERLSQMCKDEVHEVLENVLLVEPMNFEEQAVAIRKLDELMEENDVSLVVVDSIAMLYRLEEERDIRELGRQLAQLLRIARKYDVPVLITNQVYTDIETGKMVPVGGDITRYWAKIMIELLKEEDIRIAVLRKHKFLKEGMKTEFRIVDSGIEPLRIENKIAGSDEN